MSDFDLAMAHRPLLMLDRREPYAPQVFGWHVQWEAGVSPSSKHLLDPQGGVIVEYAVWYDWDIQHLFDLEHVWVRLEDGAVTEVTASFHGKRVTMDLTGGLPELRQGRPVLYVEPGKHAHWADPVAMRLRSGALLMAACGPEAGREGVHRGNRYFEAGLYGVTPLADRLAKRKMMRDGFVPSFAFREAAEPEMLPLAELMDSIPGRVTSVMEGLPQGVPHLAAVFLDCGDTLVDEGSEVKEPGSEVVLRGEFIPGAVAAVKALKAEGYPLVLVADGPRATFENLLKPAGLWDLFDGHVISGDVGVLKPDAKMFAAAMACVGLSEADRGRVVMVGNNLARDIRGAKAFGLKSLLVGWSDRRSMVPSGPEEMPDARIDALEDLPGAIAALELSL